MVWTIYAEQRHLMLYVGDPEIAFGIGEYIDIVVTATLLIYAVYEIFHFAGRTRRLDAYVAAHPACKTLTFLLLAALAWGIYRDLTHFRHLFASATAVPFDDDDIDEVAGGILALGALKTGYHGLRAVRVFSRLIERRRLN